VRCRDIVRHAVDPRPQRAAAIEQLQASPKLEMNILQQIPPPLRVGLVTAAEPPNHGPVLRDCLFIQRVLLAAVHSRSILLSTGNSLRGGSVSYINPVLAARREAAG
jgi:hypothetical protein